MVADIKEKDGSLYVVLTYIKSGKWERKWIPTTFTGKDSISVLRKELKAYIQKYAYLECDVDGTDTDFVNYLLLWHEKRKTELEKSTWESYDIIIKTHIIPYFENAGYNISDITSKDLYQFYDYLVNFGNIKTGAGLSNASVKKIISVIKVFFKSAMSNGIIESNPAQNARIPKTRGCPIKHIYLDQKQANKMLDAFSGH